MPIPQGSSLLHRHLFVRRPASEWLSQTATESEFVALLSVVIGTPANWLEWVEMRATKAEDRGVKIENPIAYRLSALWNGMIFLQEMKYLADLLETTLRQAFASYCIDQTIALGTISKSIPNSKQVLRQAARSAGGTLNLAVPPSPALLSCFTFYQLTEAFARNWKHVSGNQATGCGFASLFWHDKACRDANLFRDSMKQVRTVRNDIAHSKRLFAECDAQHLLALVSRWLEPLGIEVRTKVEGYRMRRPRFLETLWCNA